MEIRIFKETVRFSWKMSDLIEKGRISKTIKLSLEQKGGFAWGQDQFTKKNSIFKENTELFRKRLMYVCECVCVCVCVCVFVFFVFFCVRVGGVCVVSGDGCGGGVCVC